MPASTKVLPHAQVGKYLHAAAPRSPYSKTTHRAFTAAWKQAGRVSSVYLLPLTLRSEL